MPQADGSQKAIAIHIFLETMRGTGEGHRPWDSQPGSTMTNATVDSTVAGVDGQTITVKYKDGEKKVIVAAQHANRRLLAGPQGRAQAGRADHHLRRDQAGGRIVDDARHQCRPRRRRTADVKRRAIDRRVQRDVAAS